MRIAVNLLPYRPARRLAKVNRLFMMWGAVALLGIVAAFLTHSAIEDHILELKEQKIALEARQKEIDDQLGEIKDIKEKKALIKQRLELIATLSRARDMSLRLLDALSLTIPEKVWLTRATTKQNELELVGKAQSNAVVADFMRALEASPYISRVDLTRVARPAKEELDLKEFTLTAHIDSLEPEKTEPSKPERSKK
ncbi:MAG: PilN domain-containing protein [Magnetococcales bacterium]|nr:PilN domain-containing protein [Magnetococcales bacterium]